MIIIVCSKETKKICPDIAVAPQKPEKYRRAHSALSVII